MDKQKIDPETELNIFARFFGAILVELRHRNLRLKYEPCTEAASEESRIEFYQHVR